MILAKFVAAMLDIAFFHIGFSIPYITGRNRKEKQSNSNGSIYINGNMFRG